MAEAGLPDDCDVEDRANLAEFRKKMAEWREALSGEDQHAVWVQIRCMLWDAALFRTVNELWRIAAEERRSDVGFNGDIQQLLTVGFLTTQVTAIRRLTEPQAKESAKKVISLRAVLRDVTAHRHVITRECYVAGDGTPYDVEAALARWIARVGTTQSGAVPGAGPEAWTRADAAHRAFDLLSARRGICRSRGDLVEPACLKQLDEALKQCEAVCKFTNKFIAHGAHPDNRSALTAEQRGVSLDRLEKCHRALYQVAYFLTGTVLGQSAVLPVPVPQYDHLANLDKPWMAQSDARRMRDFWRETVAAIESWSEESIWPPGSPGGASEDHDPGNASEGSA